MAIVQADVLHFQSLYSYFHQRYASHKHLHVDPMLGNKLTRLLNTALPPPSLCQNVNAADLSHQYLLARHP